MNHRSFTNKTVQGQLNNLMSSLLVFSLYIYVYSHASKDCCQMLTVLQAAAGIHAHRDEGAALVR